MMDMNKIKAVTAKNISSLRKAYETGQLSITGLHQELVKLSVQDKNGTWWALGYESLEWYCYDDESSMWIKSQSILSK